MVGHFEFEKVEIFQGISLHENAHLFYSNGLAMHPGDSSSSKSLIYVTFRHKLSLK